MQRTSLSRRGFLRRASAGAVSAITLPSLIPAHALGAPGQPGANERVNVGIIGLGGRARDIAKTCRELPAIRIAAVCDCFQPRCEKFVSLLGEGQNWRSYEDFRQMIAREKLDGVMVETTTHARAWVTILAMQAGLDVYIEKPMCLTVTEGRAMVQAARRYRRVTQVGSQQRSIPLNNWASDLVKNGVLGKIHTVIAPNFLGPDQWVDKPAQPLPAGGSAKWWDVWTNQAVYRPYHPLLHAWWALWWDYEGGKTFGVTGWGTHSYDQVNRALGTDDTGPLEVLLEEPARIRPSGRFERQAKSAGLVGEDDTGAGYHAMAKREGWRAKVSMRFATGTTLKLHLDGDRGPSLGAIFIGEKGKLEINRNKIAANPRELLESPDNPGPNPKPETYQHIENWVDCVKTRKRCNADVEIGQRSTTVCHLVNIARAVGRVGETLKWDPAAEQFTNCPEANRLLSRPRRKGYELPAIG